MPSGKRKGFRINIMVLICAVALGFPGVVGKLIQAGVNSNRVLLSYSYSSPKYKVDVKDIRSDKDINLVYKELEKSKYLGEHYPEDRESVSHEGSFFIVERNKDTYKIAASICWYGEKSSICLVQRGSAPNQYIEMTPELQKFFNSRFLGKKNGMGR